MVYLKEFQRDGKPLLSIVDKENDNPRSGNCFQIYRSLRRLKVNQTPVIEPSSFPSKFSIRVEKGAEDGSVGYFLQSTYHDKSSLLTEFPVVRRRIISGQSRWSPNMILYGDFGYIPLFWEWTEHVLLCFEARLQRWALYEAVYVLLYSNSRDIHVVRAFYESSVLPPILFIRHLAKCLSHYGICTSLVDSQLMANSTMRPSPTSRPLSTGTSKI